MNRYSLVRCCFLKCLSIVVEHIQAGLRILSAIESGVRLFFRCRLHGQYHKLSLKLCYEVSEILLFSSVEFICSSWASLLFRVSQTNCSLSKLNTHIGGMPQSMSRFNPLPSFSQHLQVSVAFIATVQSFCPAPFFFNKQPVTSHNLEILHHTQIYRVYTYMGYARTIYIYI